MCFPGGVTHITRDMYFPGGGNTNHKSVYYGIILSIQDPNIQKEHTKLEEILKFGIYCANIE